MSNKREVIFGIFAAGIAAAVASPARAAPEQDAAEALQAWTDAVFTGDPAIVEKVLAPEFQIMRSDGTGYVKADYLGVLPKQKAKSVNSGIIATAQGEHLVVRYTVQSDQTINGKKVQSDSPRLGVFRKEGASWLLVSLANFAKIG